MIIDGRGRGDGEKIESVALIAVSVALVAAAERGVGEGQRALGVTKGPSDEGRDDTCH